MKNIQHLSGKRLLRIPVQGMPPLKGWAIKYLSGMQGDPEIKPGYWLDEWIVSPDRLSATIRFDAELHMCFHDETEAKQVCEALRSNAELETEVV